VRPEIFLFSRGTAIKMIDLHCHILPGIDDGAGSLSESIEMCRIAVNDGISKVVCVPHHVVGKYNNNREKITRCVEKLQASLNDEDIPLTLYPGCEIRLDLNLVENIKTGELMTMNDSGRYITLELPNEALPQNIEEIISSFIFVGIVPIIGHPERNQVIRNNPGVIYRLVGLGALTQLTSASLTGLFGSEIKKFSIFLLKHKLAHMLMTDAHSSKRRRPVLSEGLEILKEIVGEKAAMEMVEAIPEKILNGEDIDVKYPVPFKEKSSGKMKKYFSLIFLCVFIGFIFACAHPVIREISPQGKKGTQLRWDRETHRWVFKAEPPARKALQESRLPSFAQAVPIPPLKKEADRLIELQKRTLTKEEYLRAKFKGKEIVLPEDLSKNGEIEVKYKIGIDDILNIYIWNHEDLSRDVPIRSDGNVSLPLIGDIHAAGLEIPEFKTIIEKKYDEYIEHPQITVTCKVPTSLQVSVVGAVEKPETYVGPATMTYTLRGDRTLMSILSVVEIRPDADLEESYIIRGDKIIPVNLKALLEDGDTSQNVILQPQDTLVIAEPLKEIVLLGEVKSPGRYKTKRKTTVLDALSRAGGINSKNANLHMAYLARGNDILPINFKMLLDYGNMSQNILLNDGDVIYIPNINENKTFVIGEVNVPGVRYFTDPMDLREAISFCGGFRETANRSQVVVVRGDPQKPEVYAVNVLKMMEGKSLERFYLEKGDTVYVARTAIADWNVFLSQMLPTLTTTRVIQTILNAGFNP